MPKLPTFVGIGVPKCGTTMLAECRREHPPVFLPEVKEVVCFFSGGKAERGDDWYSRSSIKLAVLKPRMSSL